jgi:hypothetical protein
MWISFDIVFPQFEDKVLLLWKKTGHIEDGTIYENEDVPGKWYHVLFDGESMTDSPSHWMSLPEMPK